MIVLEVALTFEVMHSPLTLTFDFDPSWCKRHEVPMWFVVMPFCGRVATPGYVTFSSINSFTETMETAFHLQPPNYPFMGGILILHIVHYQITCFASCIVLKYGLWLLKQIWYALPCCTISSSILKSNFCAVPLRFDNLCRISNSQIWKKIKIQNSVMLISTFFKDGHCLWQKE